jgi:hypothetical protein
VALADAEASYDGQGAVRIIDALLAQGGFGAAVAHRFNRERDAALADTINK